MNDIDPVTLSRIQFAFTVTFHIIFPTISIGLAAFLTLIEGLWLKTSDQLYLRIYKFWLVIFAMAFGVGVVTGIVLSFQFGTNWARFSQMAGPVLAPMIGLEVLTSFFLEAGFLGIMLFGLGRVSKRLHFLSTCMVALGSHISSCWIMSANSWMQTPAGFILKDGRFEVTDWAAAIINPSFIPRLSHMLLAAYISAAFMVAGIGAWYLLKRRHIEFARKTVSIAMGAATLLIATQTFLGDMLAGVIAGHQPSKIQAIEGHWDDTPSAPYLLYIKANQAEQRNEVSIGIPHLGSLLVTHTLTGSVAGLKRTPMDLQPNMAAVFFGFRFMFVVGVLMFITSCISLWLRITTHLFDTKWFLRLLVLMTPTGLIATVGGWYASEAGRQPWMVFGQLKTIDSASPVAVSQVAASLMLFILIYGLFGGSFFVLALRRIRNGPQEFGDSGTLPPAVGVVKRGHRRHLTERKVTNYR